MCKPAQQAAGGFEQGEPRSAAQAPGRAVEEECTVGLQVVGVGTAGSPAALADKLVAQPEEVAIAG